jgi:Fe-S cluster biogenesis protein NfuA
MNNKDGQCKHCALQHITTANTLPLEQNLREQFEQIRSIKETT